MLDILLVEDHKDTANAMSRLLRSLGHQVRVAESVARAMELAKEKPFELMLSDIGLPDATGIELMLQLKAHFGRDLPAIALTGYGMQDDVEKCLAAGFAGHLTKPVNFQTLETVIHQVAAKADLPLNQHSGDKP